MMASASQRTHARHMRHQTHTLGVPCQATYQVGTIHLLRPRAVTDGISTWQSVSLSRSHRIASHRRTAQTDGQTGNKGEKKEGKIESALGARMSWSSRACAGGRGQVALECVSGGCAGQGRAGQGRTGQDRGRLEVCLLIAICIARVVVWARLSCVCVLLLLCFFGGGGGGGVLVLRRGERTGWRTVLLAGDVVCSWY
ncbi:hypothetical protein BKA81DRAFT_75842 [Phyllosticta paracitricarpa]